MLDDVLISEEKEHILTLSINRPEKRNSLNAAVLRRLGETFSSLKADGKIRVVVLRGAGEQAFSAGVDLRSDSAEEDLGTLLGNATDSIVNCPCPVIAMIYRYAVGAGCDISAACDFRIADDSARMGINPVKLGLIYSPKSIQRFVNLIGVAHTKELFLTGRFLTVQRAKEMGLVNQIVPADALPETVYSLAREIAENAPLAVAGTKFVISKLSYNQKLTSDTEAEIRAVVEACERSEDIKEGMKAFSEKRKPVFKGC